jgi:hypothetical protein
MALYIFQPGIQPLGQFDFLDEDITATLRGGEIGTFDMASRTQSATERFAADADGYVSPWVDVNLPTSFRPVLRLANHGAADGYSLMYLLDDGQENYGTLFGDTIGTPVGMLTTATSLGPHTAAASGKVTAWDKAGLYGVSLDSVHSGTTPNSQLISGGDTPLPGELLYRHSTNARLARWGELTGVPAATRQGNRVAVFIEMTGSPSLVTTPARLVGASAVYDRITIQYLGAGTNCTAASWPSPLHA